MNDDYCLNCAREMIPTHDNDPNGQENAVCAQCRAEEEHDFDAEPGAVFNRAGHRIDEAGQDRA